MDKKFALNKDCFLVKGAKRGAIYDLNTGDVYSIDENSTEILDFCEKGYSLSKIFNQFPMISQKKIENYLKQLENIGLGRFLKEREKIKKIFLKPLPKKLDFIWLELTEKCNLRCIHCYVNGGDNNYKKNKQNLTLEDWKRSIKEAAELGCRKIQFIGGEPFLFGKKIFDLIKLASELDYRLIEIFTNATLLTDEYIKLIAKYKVRIAVSIYSKRSEIHDEITKTKGSFAKATTNIHKLKAKGIKVRFAFVVMKQNQNVVEETVNYLNSLGEENALKSFDLVRSVGRGSNASIVPNRLSCWMYRGYASFLKVNKLDYLRAKTGHGCWSGKFCITSTGDIIPCTIVRNCVCGNIKKQSLIEIVNGKALKKIWGLSKDKIEVCKDCEYRYVCFNCPLQNRNNCLYDPYQGIWLKKKLLSKEVGNVRN